MNLFEAFWRALLTCAEPRTWLLMALPLVPVAAAVGLLGWVLWEPSLDAVQALLGRAEISDGVWRWLHDAGGSQLRSVLAPMAVVVLALPLVLLLALLAVTGLATPTLARRIAADRFPGLSRLEGCPLPRQLLWVLGSVAAALLALVASLPLWLIPPLVLLLPPLIWGWLAARLFSYQALATHASADERRRVRRGRRLSLWAMGVASGYAALLPMGIWALGSMAFVLAPLFMIVAAAMFVLVFVFCAAWFTHFVLAELSGLRQPSPHGGSLTEQGALP